MRRDSATKSTSSNESFERSPRRGSQSRPTRTKAKGSLSVAQYALIAVAGAHYVLGVMGANYWQLVRPERLLLVAGGFAGFGCVVAFLLNRAGVGSVTAFFVALLATVFLVRGGPLLWRIDHPWGWFVVAAALAIGWHLSRSLPDSAIWIASVGLVVAIASGSAIDSVNAFTSMGRSSVSSSPLAASDLASKPDIYFVVLDGYPGLEALSRIFGEQKGDLKADLTDLGFQVPVSAWTAYGSTELAVPSILDMSYPVDPKGLTDASRRDLFEIISGENSTVSLLTANGYQTTMIESGWVGSYCGHVFDSCIPSIWLDEVMFNIVWNSLASDWVVGAYGHAFTSSALSVIETLDGVVTDHVDNGEPEFVFAHVIAPHPPYFLDENCDLVVDRVRARSSINPMEVHPASDSWFLQQTECVDSFVRELGAATRDDDIVVVLGDHGRRTEIDESVRQKPEDRTVLELMNVFLAARIGPGCELTDPILTSDVLRQVLTCVTEEPLKPVPPRMFLHGGYEMNPAEIRELMTLDSGASRDVP